MWEDIPLPGLNIPSQTCKPATRMALKKIVTDPSLEVTPSAEKSFWKNVVKSPSCWFWVGAISSPDGYGRITWQVNGRQRTLSAHRFAMLLSGYRLDTGTVCEHHCNEPLCVRVDDDHVFPSTQSANISYAVELGRHRGNKRAVDIEQNFRVDRSRRIRDALKKGWDSDRFFEAINDVGPRSYKLF